MKRYFTTSVDPLASAFHCGSVFHFLNLPGGGHVVCMMNGEFDPDPAWTELPHLLETTAAAFDGVQNVMGASAPALTANSPAPIAGVARTDTTYQVAKKLATLHPLFRP